MSNIETSMDLRQREAMGFWKREGRREQWQRIVAKIEQVVSEIPSFGFEQEKPFILEKPGFRAIWEVGFSFTEHDGERHKSDRQLIGDKKELDKDGTYTVVFTEEEELVFLLQARAGRENHFAQIEFPAGVPGHEEDIRVAARREAEEEAGAELTDSIRVLGAGPVLIGRSPQATHFFSAEASLSNAQRLEESELIKVFTIRSEDALLFLSTILSNQDNPILQGLEVDPKTITVLTLEGIRCATCGEQERARKIFSFLY